MIAANNRNEGAGRIYEGEESTLVRIEGRIRTVDDVREIVVDTHDGTPIRASDVASVASVFSPVTARSPDGRGETVEGLVLGLRGANAGQLVRDVRARLAEIEPSLPKGVEIKPFYDRGRLVRRAVGTVVRR